MMKRSLVFLSLLVIALLVVSLVVSCTPKPKETVILRLVVPAPPGDMLTVKDEELAARFNERAGGEYEIKVYPGEQLVKMPEYLDAVRTGAVEIMDAGWGIFGGLDPRLGVHETPFLYNNIRAGAASQEALVELFAPMFQEKFNQKPLASFTTGAMELIGNKPVKTLEDWKGTLVGAINPPIAGMVVQMGGSPVTIMWTDMYTNLEKGVIDAGLISNQGTLQLGIYDVITQNTTFYGPTGQNAYNINLDVWNAMPQRIQDILLEETRQTAATMNETFIRLFDEDIESLRDKGVDVYVLPNAERERWKETCQPLIEQNLAAAGEFGQQVKQICDEANSQFPN
jgi:TRAP-type C4-dicarboxylate transport system substrate-binding protein